MKKTEKAVDAVHTYTMTDGTVVTTTWHDSSAKAEARVASVKATFRGVFPGGCLGKYRAVTWATA